MEQVESQEENRIILEVNPQDVINLIDSSLQYAGKTITTSGHSRIYFVSRAGNKYVLKLNKSHELSFENRGTFTLEHEHKVIEKMRDIEGVVNAHQFYDNAPSYQSARSYIYNQNDVKLKKGKNAILLERIEGPTLTAAEYPPRGEFFTELSRIREKMQKRGYVTPIVDFNPDNVMIRKDERNRDRPVIIDLMCAVPLHKNKRIREEQIFLSEKAYQERILSRYIK